VTKSPAWVNPDEYIDAGEHVVVRGVQRATGAGGSFESRYLHLFKLRDGKIVRGEYISDTAKAKEALGS
jgi:ketosteroid isomerase-like protein